MTAQIRGRIDVRWQGQTAKQKRTRLREGVRAFAILPTQMDDGTWVWLEHYWRLWYPMPSNGGVWRHALTREEVRRERPPDRPPNARKDT